MFPLEKYKYYVNEEKRTVAAVQTFATKKYSGVARCDAEDTFDVEKGKKLAALKCNAKITNARVQYAEKRLDFFQEMFTLSEEDLARAKEYYTSALREDAEAVHALTKFVDEEL